MIIINVRFCKKTRMRFYLKERAMKKNKKLRESLNPALSRRHFIQAGSALAALPFVVKGGKAQAATMPAAVNEPEEKVIQTCSTFDLSLIHI